MNVIKVLAILGLGASWLSACSDDVPSNPDGQGAEPEPAQEPEASPEPEPEACVENADCRGGEVCRQGRCLQFCAEDSPCEVGVCLLDQSVCVECLERAHCTPGRRCDAESHRCVEAECVEDIDCQGGFQCVEGTCASIISPFCQSNARTCQGDTLLICSPDGATQTSIPCAEGERCVEDELGGACLPEICAPFEVGCLDDQSAFLCDETGTGRERLPCRDNQSCVEGVCTPHVCVPNQALCQGDTLTTCDPLGLSQEAILCAQTPECQESPFGCACAGAACRPLVCEPGVERCVDNAVESCSPDGLERITVSCEPNGLCLGGVCQDVICEPSAALCRGERLVTCNNLGTAEVERDCQASGAFCDDAGALARCAPRVCQPGARVCVGGRSGTCNARGSALAPGSTDCGAQGQACRLGQCTDECEPGERFCQGEVVFECQDDRLTLRETPCGQGEFCDEGQCLPRVCEPQAQVCVGQLAGVCDERGSGVEGGARDCALEGLSCAEGACVVCAAGQTRCAEGDRVEVCEGGRWRIEPRSNLGCRFWSIDLDNIESGMLAPHGVVLLNSDNAPAQISVERGSGQPLQITQWPSEIAPQGSSLLDFDSTFIDQNTNLALLDPRYVSGTIVGDQCFLIQTSAPASAFQFNPLRAGSFTVDGSLLFPQGAAGTEFFVLSWQHRNQLSLRGFITVVAVDDEPTTISITPTARVVAGTNRLTEAPVSAIDVGELRSFTLERGQIVNLESEGPDRADLSGSRISSDRPVLVFSGHACANVPIFAGFCDHLEEMMPSVDQWGAHHVVADIAQREGQLDLFQIVASEDQTEVQLVPPQAEISTQTLSRGQVLSFQTKDHFEVIASAPVLVGHYITGGQNVSDPSFMVVPSVDAWLTRNDVFMLSSFLEGFINVVTRAGNAVFLDGELVEDWQPIHDSDFVVAQIPTNSGAHTLTSEAPFWSSVYGYNGNESFFVVGGRGL